jgi:hypothetical protein
MPAKLRSANDGGSPPEYPFSVGDVLRLPDGSTVDVRVGTGVEFLLWPYGDQGTTHPSHCTFDGTIFRLAGEESWPANEAVRINNVDIDPTKGGR